MNTVLFVNATIGFSENFFRLILSCLSDFMTCWERFNIQNEGSTSQLWNTVGR